MKARQMEKRFDTLGLNTVCESAKCPNKGECYERGTATFLILGDVCTRNCTFCAVKKSSDYDLLPVNPGEPEAISELVRELSISHVVITTVTRDDLKDGGADQFIRIIENIRKVNNHQVTVEFLISDLKGNFEALEKILSSKPEILNHNVETVPELYPRVRPMADFKLSLQILQKAKLYAENSGISLLTKSGFMLGLGETEKQIRELLTELRKVDVDIVTIGQYLAPSVKHHPVMDYIHPDKFAEIKQNALSMGFKICEASPLVRSSYHAEEALKKISIL